jgi:hypothetical protein
MCSFTAQLQSRQHLYLFAGVGEGHIAAVSAVAFSCRGPSFMVSGGADKLLKVIPDNLCQMMLQTGNSPPDDAFQLLRS